MIKPAEFNNRVIRWARLRCGLQLSQATIEDWVQEGILAPATPTGLARAGQPSWERTCSDLRRAILICRYKSLVPETRQFRYDEIRIQLWLDRIELDGVDIQKLIREQFRRSRQELLRPLRSVFDPRDGKGISAKRVETSVRQMGAASPEILPTDFEYFPSELAAILAAAQFGNFEKLALGDIVAAPIDLLGSILDRWGLGSFMTSSGTEILGFISLALAGMLGDSDEIDNAAENVIGHADVELFEIAREITRALPRVIRSAPTILPAVCSADPTKILALSGPCQRIAKAIRFEPQWRLAAFVIMLVTTAHNAEQARSIADALKSETLNLGSSNYLK